MHEPTLMSFRDPRTTVVAILVAVALVLLPAPSADAAISTDCSGAVCEEVIWSGSTVTSWKATLFPGGGWHCKTARFYINGGLWNSDVVCGYGYLTGRPTNLPTVSSGWSLCALWVGYGGYACITT